MMHAEPLAIFDRQQVRRNRNRAAATWPHGAFLIETVSEKLVDRLMDVNRTFPIALDLGCHAGETGRRILGVRSVATVIYADTSPAFASQAPGPALVAEEDYLPFAPAVFDLCVSALSLHWVNDLPGALLQIRQLLRPDGLFLAALAGGRTLEEMRVALTMAEDNIKGGASPRVSPFAGVSDAGALLLRAGFALPVAAREEITVSYPNALALMRDLRAMGETNALNVRARLPLTRATLVEAARLYQERFAEADGRVPATFEILWLSGWAPTTNRDTPQNDKAKPAPAGQGLPTPHA